MDESAHDKPVTKKLFRFEKIALILGFVVDAITLTSIILAVRLQGPNFSLASFITPGLAFGIWVLAVYTYCAYLHHYWERNYSRQGLENSFGSFLLNDLILRFRKPLALLPAIVSFITLFWIADSADESHSLPIVLFVFALFGGAALFAARGYLLLKSSSGELKQKIDGRWGELKKGIKAKLARQQWLSCSDLSDVAETWGIPTEALSYALARYATENPTSTEYATVFRQEDGERVSDFYVLINLQGIQRDMYYWQ